MQPGDKIGRYLLEKPLGEGAMSMVFVAKHPQLDPRVAIKILRREVLADRQYGDRFLEDARAAAILNHPNIVRVTDFDTADGVPFIVMDLVEGWSLEQRLKESGKLPVTDAARVARDIAQGLGAAHASKIVHRDVKPSNVLLDSRTGMAKLTDFGAAKRERSEDLAGLTAHGQAIGTPRYMAPEQVNGDAVDPRTDLWALGATLYEMLAGQPAFSANNLARLYQSILADEPPKLIGLRPDVPPELASLVSRLLSKSRTARPDTADEVAEALLPFTRPGATSTEPKKTVLPPDGPKRDEAPTGWSFRKSLLGRPMLVGGGIAAAILALIVAVPLWPSGEDEVAVQVPAEPVPAPAPEPEPAPPQPPVEQATPAPEPPPAPEPAVAPAPEPAPPPVEPAPPPVEQATPAPTPEPPPETPPPTETAALPVINPDAVRAVLASIPCLDASGMVADAGVVRLTGTAADAAIVDEAKSAVGAIPGVTTVASELGISAAPACVSAVQIQRTLRNPVAPAPTVALNRPDGVYRDGDFLVLDVTMPPDFGGYVYATMLQDNSVYHLLPEPLTPNNRVEAGKSIQIGVEEGQRREGVRDWQVTPPLHPGYLVVMATEKPLFARDRGIEEGREPFLTALLPMLQDPATRATAVAMRRLDFVER